jgi:CheY-like chemotaxis protein
MDDLNFTTPKPTPQRPLMGLTVLIVEDSRFASEALRLLCLRSGARIRRADCLASARRHLQTYRPNVAIVDIGLPDGSGLDLIAALNAAPQRPGIVLATSGQDRSMAETQALAAGANGFLPKPVESLAAFQQAILHHLPPEARPKGLRLVSSDIVRPDRLAMTEDLAHVARMLEDEAVPDTFISGFLKGIARTGHDEDLLRGAEAFATHAVQRAGIRALIQKRLLPRRAV